MSDHTPNMNDPLSFLRNMWSGMGVSMPGMVTPTFDIDELDKRITDMKAVEGWLRMNLSMLQMTIQGLEMQRTTLTAVKAMGEMASESARAMTQEGAAAPEAAPVDTETSAAFSDAAMWPWQMMQQMREKIQQGSEAVQAAAEAPAAAKKAPARRTRK